MDGSDQDEAMHTVVRLLCRFYQILDSESQFLSAAVKEELPALGQKLAEYYSWLATDAFESITPKRLWKESPKLHLFEHLCQHVAILYGNPRFYWCYADEDLVGKMIEIAETVHPTTLAFSVLFKWLHLFFVNDE